jgi:hypothetical protein
MYQLESWLAHERGEVSEQPCSHCEKDQGVFVGCITVIDVLGTSCTNFHYSGFDSKCSFSRPSRLVSQGVIDAVENQSSMATRSITSVGQPVEEAPMSLFDIAVDLSTLKLYKKGHTFFVEPLLRDIVNLGSLFDDFPTAGVTIDLHALDAAMDMVFPDLSLKCEMQFIYDNMSHLRADFCKMLDAFGLSMFLTADDACLNCYQMLLDNSVSDFLELLSQSKTTLSFTARGWVRALASWDCFECVNGGHSRA